MLSHVPGIAPLFAGIEFGILPHAAVLLIMLAATIRNGGDAGRIDGLMAVALSYILWFVLIPLLNLI